MVSAAYAFYGMMVVQEGMADQSLVGPTADDSSGLEMTLRYRIDCPSELDRYFDWWK